MTDLEISFHRPQAAHDEVLRQLRHAIVQGRLRPGEQIRQEQLAQSFGLSRVPIREALKTLAGERLVIHEANRGFFVTRLSVAELSEIYRARDLLETEMLSVANEDTLFGIVGELQRLHLVMDEAHRTNRSDTFASANRDFHFAIIGSADRPLLTNIVRQLWDSTEAYRALIFTTTNRLELINREHQMMIDAVQNRDRKTLARLLQTHRSVAITVMQKLLPVES